MEVIGIIAEYNPFHNGHLYHINKIKEMYPDSILVLVLNGYFLERGEISLLNKEDKTKIALRNKIDLVLELPSIFGMQSADVFAEYSIKILNELKVSKIIIGSEVNNPKLLYDIAEKQLDEKFDEKVKNELKNGVNYPTALAKSLNVDFEYKPNDLLGISYAKSIIKNKFDISLETIQRTNDYHDVLSSEDIVSASNIREKIKQNEDIKKYLPNYVIKSINKIDNNKLFELIKYRIISDKNLDDYLDVAEGIDNLLKDVINKVSSTEELILKVKSKRYTYNKINRMLIHILIGLTKSDAKSKLKYINILGFNKKGKAYLNKIKKDINTPLKKDFNSKQYEYELKSSIIYDMLTNNNTVSFEKLNKPINK